MQFVKTDSIVRTIWGRRDTILFIFGGSAAEFALNKAVDWLFFTGRLPADPIGRLFSTVVYAQKIIFSGHTGSLHAIDTMRNIHKEVEHKRADTIPGWAYRDVLYMLIYYSIVSFELLERKLSTAEKEEIYDVFKRVGLRMGLTELPDRYTDWLQSRAQHLDQNLERSKYNNLFIQYKKHLGAFRYAILKEAQILVIPPKVRSLLGYKNFSWLKPVVPLYKLSHKLRLDWHFMRMLLPAKYTKQIYELQSQKA
jgi:hypothetical protein